MKKVGLTGGIASGKSTSTKIFIEKGFKVIDADKVVKDILDKDEEVLKYIKLEFGEEFILDNKILKREFGNYIFSHKLEREKYENFIMDKIFKKIDYEFEFHKINNEKICILDAPILIEKNLHLKMDYVILVWSRKEDQLIRLMSRDNMSREEALNRINSQMDIDLKKDFSDFILYNSGNQEYLREQIENVCSILKKL